MHYKLTIPLFSLCLMASCSATKKSHNKKRYLASLNTVEYQDDYVEAADWDQVVCESSLLEHKVIKSSELEDRTLSYRFKRFTDSYQVFFPFRFVDHKKWLSCHDSFSNYLFTPSGQKIHFTLEKDSQVIFDRTICSEMIGLVFKKLGLVTSEKEGEKIFKAWVKLPRYRLTTCTCSRLDRGRASFFHCRDTLKKDKSCPEEAYKHEIIFTYEDYKTFDQFKNAKCLNKKSTFSKKHYSRFYSQKKCENIERKISLLAKSHIQEIFPENCTN